jgi:Holliday junction resolvase
MNFLLALIIIFVILPISVITIVTMTIVKSKKTKRKSFHKPYNEKWKDDFIQPRYKKKKHTSLYERNINNTTTEDKMYKEYKEQTYTTTNPMKYNQYLNTHEIAEELNTSNEKVIKAIFELKWVEKSGKWTIATDQGHLYGAEERYSKKYKTKYVMWNKSILENKQLLETINTYTPMNDNEKIEKGKEYEEYVAKVYRSRGYNVSEYGKDMGVKDKGIDLIAKKDKHIVLLQCKNWNENGKWKITHKEIKTFQTEARNFVEDAKIFQKYLLDARYAISGDFIHNSAIKHIEEMKNKGKRIDYEIIKMPAL